MAVVVASFRDPALLDACLSSIEVARARVAVPVLVARAGDGADVAAVAAHRPWVTVVPVGGIPDVPRLRGAGMEAAPAVDRIAVTEDHCLVEPHWLERLRDGGGGDADVVGGGMGNARRGVVDWAAYFSEYGFFSSARSTADSRPGGPPLLTGANVAYSARVAPEVARRALAGQWENTIHADLHQRGAILRWEPRARVLQNGTYRVGAFCRDRFDHGRDYARTRVARGTTLPRWLLAAGTALLPLLLTYRVARAAGGEAPRAFLLSLPVTVTFLGAWSLGEAVGYLKGAR